MSKQFKLMIMVNALLIFLFLIANYALWNMVNSNTHLGHTVMNPLNVIESMWGDVVEGEIYRIDGMGIMPNFPFWLFFVAIAINMYFIFRLQRTKET
jgi:hypothetical protein